MERDPKAQERLEQARHAAAEKSHALRAGRQTTPPVRPGAAEQRRPAPAPAVRAPAPQPPQGPQVPTPAAPNTPQLASRQQMMDAREQLRDTTNAKLIAQQLSTTLAEFRPLVKQAADIAGELRSIVGELKEMFGPLGDPNRMERFTELVGAGVPLQTALSEVLAPHGGSSPTEDPGNRR